MEALAFMPKTDFYLDTKNIGNKAVQRSRKE